MNQDVCSNHEENNVNDIRKTVKKKILILTLGTGAISKDGSAGYRKSQYVIEGKPYEKNGIETMTNFVAEPIIDFFEPDDIFILGTVKSVWHQFYASTITDNNDDLSYMDDAGYKRLLEIEVDYNNGINTDYSLLEKYWEEISGIFNKISSWEKYSTRYKGIKPGVHVLLTKYGINEEELKENYRIIKNGIEKHLNEKTRYEVAFDITHSFRSLPIYNLIIFNYIKNITRYDISISHVYYGNIDASHELGMAPIVDLSDLIEVLNLTNGVAEFKDTGNAVYLSKMLENDEEERKELVNFDLATQINGFDRVKEELKKLYEISMRKADDERYSGIREMISMVLSERFFGEEINIEKLNKINDTDLKFLLTRWYFNQNRMGLGLATGLEALRDINTPAFMSSRSFNLEDERKYRESAENYFISVAQRISKNEDDKSELENTFCKMGVKLRHYKDIRNVFAHSLIIPGKKGLDGIRKDIEDFRNDLFELKKLHDNNRDEYDSLFETVSLPKISPLSDNCRIVLNCLGNCSYGKYSSSSNKKNYDVFFLEEKVRKKLFYGISDKNYPKIERGRALYYYLKDKLPEGYDITSIIIRHCPDKDIEAVFRLFLEVLCNNNDKHYLFTDAENGIKPCKQLGIIFPVDSQIIENQRNELVYEDIMDIPLVRFRKS